MEYISNTLGNLIEQTAFMNLTVGNLIMIAVACVFLYLAIRHGFEPLLLVPIAFGMLLVNIYPDIMLHAEDSANGTGGLLYYFYVLDEWSILPSLIFLGVGAMALRCQCIAFPLNSIIIISNMLLQVIRKPVKATILSVCRQGLILIPVLLITTHIWGLLGLEIAQPISDVTSAVVSAVLVASVLNEFKQKDKELQN